jgi:outer membrane protein assembly factor BamB
MKRMKPKTIWRLPVIGISALALSACGIFGGGGDKKDTPTVGNRVPILSRIATEVTADPELAGISVIVPTATVNTEWAQTGGNAANSNGHLALASAPQQAWSVSIEGGDKRRRLASAPVISQNRLFAVDTQGAVNAFDATTGARLWRMAIGGDEGDSSAALFGGGVSAAGDRVYATSGLGNVVALDAATGAEIWRVKPAGPLRGAPTVAFNSVYVMTQDNQIHALNITDGSPIWQDSGSVAQAGVFGVAAPAAGQGTVIAGYSSGELAAYRYENGRNLWSDALARTSISTQVGTLTDVDADPIIDGGRVYALGQGGRMAAYELVTGQRIWELNLAGISTPAVAGEWIFTLTDDARILAIAKNSGKVRWLTQLPNFKNVEKREDAIFWTGPVLAGNRLWVASSRGKLYTVDVQTGEAAEYRDLGEPVSLPPVVANQTLYVMDDGGNIRAFR